MTEIVSYKVVKSIPVESTMKKLWNKITFKKDLFNFEVEFKMKTSVGYYYKNLLMLDDYRRVIVLKSDGINILVKTVTPAEEFNSVKRVLTIITRKWGGEI